MQELSLNEIKCKLQGVVNIPKELRIDRSYDIQITNCECTGSKDISNNNGTFDRQYIIKISELSEIFISFDKEIIKARKKGSQAQILRYKLQDMADKLGKDREEYYKRYMSLLIEKINEKL